MPPMSAATCWSGVNSPPGHSATTPTASMPGTRGNVTPSATPSRMCSSDRFSPNARTRISTQPAAGSGTGSSRMTKASGGPGPSSTTARIVSAITSSNHTSFHKYHSQKIVLQNIVSARRPSQARRPVHPGALANAQRARVPRAAAASARASRAERPRSSPSKVSEAAETGARPPAARPLTGNTVMVRRWWRKPAGVVAADLARPAQARAPKCAGPESHRGNSQLLQKNIP